MDIFAVIADPTRRTMLDMMKAGERAAGEFVAAFPNVSQPAISQHLKVLRDGGLVSVRADKQRRIYALDSRGLAAARSWIESFETTPVAEPQSAETMKPKPARSTRIKPIEKQAEPVMLDLFG